MDLPPQKNTTQAYSDTMLSFAQVMEAVGMLK